MSSSGSHADHVAEGDSFDVEDLPGWLSPFFPMLFVVLGAISCIGIVTEGAAENTVYAVLLVALAVSPWVLSLAGFHLYDPLYAGAVIVPIGVLVVFGESLGVVDLDQGAPQLVMMLLVGIAGQVATVGTPRLLWITTVAVFGVVIAGGTTRGDFLDYLPWMIGVALGVGGGRAFRANVMHVAQLRAAQDELARQAVSEERRRIAREVHDIVAHTMSVTMLHLTAARLAIRRDPDAAEQALVEAERHGRSSMEDIRGVVRLLRSDESAVAAALPDHADLSDLVDRYVSAGSDVELRIDGSLASLAPAVRLAVFRVVQESLSNAARHGRDPVVIDVRSGDEVLEVEVTNPVDAPGPFTPGAGLVGMRERIEMLDGTFVAGPCGADGAAGSWRVHARIPT